MNFKELFDLLKPAAWWNDIEGYWYCSGCSRRMDRPELELHWPTYCSLNKLKLHHKIRQQVIEANPKLYSEYLKSRGISEECSCSMPEPRTSSNVVDNQSRE